MTTLEMVADEPKDYLDTNLSNNDREEYDTVRRKNNFTSQMLYYDGVLVDKTIDNVKM